jgi:hypothetical protein
MPHNTLQSTHINCIAAVHNTLQARISTEYLLLLQQQRQAVAVLSTLFHILKALRHSALTSRLPELWKARHVTRAPCS